MFTSSKGIRKALYKRRPSAPSPGGGGQPSSSIGYVEDQLLAPVHEHSDVTKPITVDTSLKPPNKYSQHHPHHHIRSSSASPHVLMNNNTTPPHAKVSITSKTDSNTSIGYCSGQPSPAAATRHGSIGSNNQLPNTGANFVSTHSSPSTSLLQLNANNKYVVVPSSSVRRSNLRRMSMPTTMGGLPLIKAGQMLAIDATNRAAIIDPRMGTCDPWEIQKIINENPEYVYSLFMKGHRCYDLIPTSTKLVVFDTQLPVRKAFFALVYNGVRAAPLWNSELQRFVGMLTITDFIAILHKYYRSDQSGQSIKELEEHKIVSWREVMLGAERSKAQLISIDPTENLYTAVKMLCANHIHRLPVLDRRSGNIAYILTHKRIIKYLHLYIHDLARPPFLDKTPRELGIGTWGDITTVTPDTPLIKVLSQFLERRISAVPVVDDQGRVIDIYAKFDVITLAADQAYRDLDVTVTDALKHRSGWFEGVRTCLESDTLATVLETLVKAEIHRMLIVDAERKVVGIVSLSDILKFFVLDNTPNDIVRHKLSDVMRAGGFAADLTEHLEEAEHEESHGDNPPMSESPIDKPAPITAAHISN